MMIVAPLVELLARLRRAPMAVPWGFRECDYPLGGAQDRRVQARLDRQADFARPVAHAARTIRSIGAAQRQFGVSVQRAAEQLSAGLAAWGRSVSRAADAALMPEPERRAEALRAATARRALIGAAGTSCHCWTVGRTPNAPAHLHASWCPCYRPQTEAR